MRRLFAVLLAGFVAMPALAAEKPAEEVKGKGEPGTNVEMPFLIAPMTGADGKLAGYAYISTILTATSRTGAVNVRDRLAFIQDAFVRDVNGSSIAKPDDPAVVDNPALQVRLLTDAKKVMGAGQVTSLVIVQVQVTPLHPSKTVAPASQAAEEPAPAPAPPAKQAVAVK